MAARIAIAVSLKATAYLPEQLLDLRQDIVLFLGRSNAGKSSLLNAISEKDLARVAKAPGKTRSINYFSWGPQLTFVDVPGYGYAERSHEERDAWKNLMGHFFDRLSSGGLAFLLMDSKRDLGEEEWDLISALQGKGLKVDIVLTKADRLNQSERVKEERSLLASLQGRGLENSLTYRFVSVKTGEGVDEIRRKLLHYGKAK